MNEEDEEESHKGCGCECHQIHGAMKGELKIAMLEKKEKILQAKLDFLGKMKEMIKKMPEEQKK